MASTTDQDRRTPTHRRLLLAGAAADGVGTGAVNVVIGVLVARRFGLAAAGGLGLTSTIGRLAALGLARQIELRARTPDALHRFYSATVGAMVAASFAVVGAAAAGPYLAVLAASTMYNATNNSTSALVASEGRRDIVRLGPLAMAGASLGAVAAAAGLAVGGPLGVVVIASALLVQLLQVPAMQRHGFRTPEQASLEWRTVVGPVGPAVLFAACTYGPLLTYSALVAAVTSPAWVGAAMLAYAAGALTAPWLERAMPGKGTWSGICALAAAGVGTWMFAVNGPAVVVGRVLSGGLMFAAQGRLLARVLDRHRGASTLAAVLTGLGIGSGIGAVATGFLAQAVGVSAMGAVLAGAALLAGTVPLVMRRRTPSR